MSSGFPAWCETSSEGEYRKPGAGASEVPWETGDSAAKPPTKTAEKKTDKAAAVKKASSGAEKKPAKQEDRGGFKKSFGGKRDFRIVVSTKDPIIGCGIRSRF